MSTTDQQILTEVQYALLETPNSGASLTSDLWSLAEVLQALNDAQTAFLQDSLLLFQRTTLPSVPGTKRFPVPSDWLATARVAWQTPTGTYSELPKHDSLQADFATPAWDSDSLPAPVGYMDVQLPSLEIQLEPLPSVGGLIHLLYAAVGATLANTGVALLVPDEFAPYVKWKTLQILLSKIGRGQDPVRAGYCQQRYDEGVLVARVLLGGWA